MRIAPLLFLLLAKNLSPQVVEEFAESIDEVSESSEFLDQLVKLRKNPVDLNTASADELLQLPWLTPFMADEIIHYRKAKGSIQHLSELESLLGFDSGLIERMSKFVFIGVPKIVEKELIIEGRSRLKLPPHSQSDYLDVLKGRWERLLCQS